MLKSHYRDNLSEFFYKESKPSNTNNLELVIANKDFKEEFNIDRDLIDIVKEDDNAIAQAYAGDQFGYFVKLGDGRAHLLGEFDSEGGLYDISLKGSGLTPYSRNGDGKARLGPMLREYLISEFLHGLGVPTSRSLGVFLTGDKVYRDGSYHDGAILVRGMEAHIRVGSFQHAYINGGDEKLEEILDYTIARLYPGSSTLEFLRKVIDRQARLIAKWMAIGFIHGVMNTDNMSISGEGFDYGPCAFIDTYDSNAVFSSIDVNGRYSFANQVNMGIWNLVRFVQTLIEPLKEEGLDSQDIEGELSNFVKLYNRYYKEELGKKLAINDLGEKDNDFIVELLTLLEHEDIDYHNFFIDLDKEQIENKAFDSWISKWEKRRNDQILSPQIIPRNHIVQKAVDKAEEGDFRFFFDLADKLTRPYEEVDPIFQKPMPEEMRPGFKTYCGT